VAETFSKMSLSNSLLLFFLYIFSFIY